MGGVGGWGGRGNIGLYRVNGKENGNYHLGSLGYCV